MTNVVTRFAPSPTGYLHIGGARTALFNWLFAKKHDGQFLLRIEDTDRQRSTGDAVEAILDGLSWLGLNSDQSPVFQSEMVDRHQQIAMQLLQTEFAYRCYMSPEQVKDEKQIARNENRRFHSPWREKAPLTDDSPYVVRLKAPEHGETVIVDEVQGNVVFSNAQMDDLVLLRSDGTPTYMLAVVVDDFDMGVTHIIRGDDHLVNAARQNLIYAALKWNTPIYAHIPLIHGPDGKKLSKRHGAVAVKAYEEMGYLPDALRNYLLRLGWSHGDQEFFTDEEAISLFDLAGINKGPSRMDFEKMAHVNAHYLRKTDTDRLLALVLDQYQTSQGYLPNDEEITRIQNAIPHLAKRSSLIPDLVTQLGFLTSRRPVTINKAARKNLSPEKTHYLPELLVVLEEVNEWQTEIIQTRLDTFAATKQIGFGKFGPALRACLTGGLPAPDLALSCALLGKDETILRINDLLT